MMSINMWVVSLVLICFIVESVRKQQKLWFWGALMCAVVLNGFFTNFAEIATPGLGDWANTVSFYSIHSALFLGSIPFLFKYVKLFHDENGRHFTKWYSPQSGGFLTLFAVSGLIMHTAFAVLVWRLGASSVDLLLANMANVYLFNPASWYGFQFILMGTMALHRVIKNEPIHMVSFSQIIVLFTICFIWLVMYVLNWYYAVPMIFRHFFR